jgi:hypothetical protein
MKRTEGTPKTLGNNATWREVLEALEAFKVETKNTFWILVFEIYRAMRINPLNAELNPICHLLVLLGDLTFMGP